MQMNKFYVIDFIFSMIHWKIDTYNYPEENKKTNFQLKQIFGK